MRACDRSHGGRDGNLEGSPELMVQFFVRILNIFSAALLVTALLSGCSSTPPAQGPVFESDLQIANQVQPASAGNLIGSGPKHSNDPIVSGGGLTSNSDPMLSGSKAYSGDALTRTDPLTGQTNASPGNTQRSIKNWYWLRGTISGGAMSVKVNGVFVGQFSVKVDTEISDYLNQGGNTVVLVPLPNSTDQPVGCHLDVVYSQQAPGSLPVLTYDTTDPGLSGASLQPQQETTSMPGSANGSGSSLPGLSVPKAPTIPTAPAQTAAPIEPVTLTFDAS